MTAADDACDRLHGVDGHTQCAPFRCYPCARGAHAEHKMNAWEPGIPCECPPCTIPYQHGPHLFDDGRTQNQCPGSGHKAPAVTPRYNIRGDQVSGFADAYGTELDRRLAAERALMAVMQVVEEYESCGPKQQSTRDVLAAVRAAVEG